MNPIHQNLDIGNTVTTPGHLVTLPCRVSVLVAAVVGLQAIFWTTIGNFEGREV